MSNESKCEPVCTEHCYNGKCSAPGNCTCFEGYNKNQTFPNVCEPICKDNCENGHCLTPNICTCNDGYRMNNKSECEPVCDQGCKNGKCTAPKYCTCFEGYKRNETSNTCEPICEKKCENGYCSSPEICTCNENYRMNNESKCEPICSQGCKNGKCTSPENCICLEGYSKSENSTNCEPFCSITCENGQCTSPEECTCDEGFKKADNSNICVVECKCTHGTCKGENRICVCEDGYQLLGDENSTTCIPVCDNACVNGECIAPQQCKCRDNYIINNDSDNNTCVSICGVECVHGLCRPEQKACDCYYGWTGRSCEVPLKCAAILEDALTGEMSDSYNDTSGNETKIETQWDGPICNKNCLHVDANQTECFNQSLKSDNSTSMLCFLNIDLDCNAVSLKDNKLKSGSVVWTMFQYVIFVVIGSIIIIVLFIFIRRYKKEQNSIAVCRSDSFLEGEDCLMAEQGENL